MQKNDVTHLRIKILHNRKKSRNGPFEFNGWSTS